MIVRTLEALFSFKFDDRKLKAATSQIDNFANKVDTAFAGLAGYFATTAVADFVNSTTNAMAEAGRIADYLGMSSEALSELRYAAEKSGVSIDTLDDSLKELQIRAVDAKSGSGEAAEAFQALGMSTTDAAGAMRDPLKMVDEIAQKLQELPSQSERIWVVDSLFGDQGVEMLKILKDGPKGLAHMRKEAQQLGATFSSKDLQSAVLFKQNLAKVQALLGVIVKKIVTAMLPAFSRFTEYIIQIGPQFSASITPILEKTSVLRAVFIGLGAILTGLAIKSAIAFAPLFLVGAAIAAVALAIDDIWTAFNGGDSVTGRVIESIKGYFASFKKWTLGILGQIWDFLPARLKKNLTKAYQVLLQALPKIQAFFKSFWIGLLNIMNTAWVKAFGALKNMFAQLKEHGYRLFKGLAQIALGQIDFIIEGIRKTISFIADLFSSLAPGFIKDGIKKSVEFIGNISAHHEQSPLSSAIAPISSNRVHAPIQNNQNMSVEVNVQSPANAHEIGSEVSKAVRKELERERHNAYMGVMNYAS